VQDDGHGLDINGSINLKLTGVALHLENVEISNGPLGDI